MLWFEVEPVCEYVEVVVRHHNEQEISVLSRGAILVNKDMFNFIIFIELLCCPYFGVLSARLIRKVPQHNLPGIGHEQLIISIIQNHLQTCLRFKLKQKLLRHNIILVYDVVHWHKEEIPVWFWGDLTQVYCGLFTFVDKFIIIDLYSFRCFHIDDWTILLIVVTSGSIVLLSISKQNFLKH